MASAFAHAFAAVVVGKTFWHDEARWRVWTWAAFCAVIPDADVIGFVFGIQYGDLLGHRGLSHSLLFALVLSLVVTRVACAPTPAGSRAWWRQLALFFGATASHGVLDAMTTGGLGVAFFSPFDPTRYFFPWRPIQVSPIGVGAFFSARGLRVILSEVVWVSVPCALFWIGGVAWRHRQRRTSESNLPNNPTW